MARLFRSLLIFLFFSSAVPPAARAGWEDDLRTDARVILQCEVAFLSQVVVRAVGDKTIVSAKATCEDKRTFNAYREDENEPFAFRECIDRNAREC